MSELFREPLVEVKNLTWQIGAKQILAINQLKIYAGDHLALIGPNGSGKSSLLKMLAFLEKPTTGKVALNIRPQANSVIEKRRQMAVIFQEPLLLNMTVYANIAYGLKIRGKKNMIGDKVNYWMERLNIRHLSSRHPKNLSGGEAQRVSIARALAMEPKILLLDEPFSSLDAPTKAQLLEELPLIIKDTGITSVFITHDFSEIPFMARQVVVLSAGKVAQQGTLEEIFYQPATAEVALLAGADNQFSGQILSTGKEWKLELTGKQVLTLSSSAYKNFAGGQPVKAFIRSEDVSLGTGNDNNFQGRVEKISPYGLQYKLTLDCGFKISLILDKHSFLTLRPKIGDDIQVNVPRDRIHVIAGT
jgi:tungstate transport system ATP-binding protein